jgi:hypothetical protein
MRCNARVAFVFYCLTVKIEALGERPLMAQSGHSPKQPLQLGAIWLAAGLS